MRGIAAIELSLLQVMEFVVTAEDHWKTMREGSGWIVCIDETLSIYAGDDFFGGFFGVCVYLRDRDSRWE